MKRCLVTTIMHPLASRIEYTIRVPAHGASKVPIQYVDVPVRARHPTTKEWCTESRSLLKSSRLSFRRYTIYM